MQLGIHIDTHIKYIHCAMLRNSALYQNLHQVKYNMLLQTIRYYNLCAHADTHTHRGRVISKFRPIFDKHFVESQSWIIISNSREHKESWRINNYSCTNFNWKISEEFHIKFQSILQRHKEWRNIHLQLKLSNMLL